MERNTAESLSATAAAGMGGSSTAGPRRRYWIKVMVYVAVLLLALILGYGILIEAQWLAVRSFTLGDRPSLRIAHFSDIHFRGNAKYMQRLVDVVNQQQPDLICITGDFVSNAGHLAGALELLEGLTSPVYAVTGNWDEWSNADVSLIADFCDRSGGRLLSDETVRVAEHDLAISGAGGEAVGGIATPAAAKHLLLLHYPLLADKLGNQQYDLILAGHSHGGQVRLPLIGSLAVPYNVGRYDLGWFETAAGPLYVTSGIGTSVFPIRLNCRPELVIIDF